MRRRSRRDLASLGSSGGMWFSSWSWSRRRPAGPCGIDLVFAILTCIGFIYALQFISDAEFASLPWSKRNARLVAVQPEPFHWVDTLKQVWYWSEVVFLLFNKKRRALHDFIGGTVFIYKTAKVGQASQDEAYPQLLENPESPGQ